MIMWPLAVWIPGSISVRGEPKILANCQLVMVCTEHVGAYRNTNDRSDLVRWRIKFDILIAPDDRAGEI